MKHSTLCKYCGAETQLYIRNIPTCVECDEAYEKTGEEFAAPVTQWSAPAKRMRQVSRA